MENDTTVPKEGLLEPVPPGSVTFDSSILVPLRNSYLYKESKERFTYSSAQLINNSYLQRKYSDFRTEKCEKGYSKEELEESFGFLLFDDESRAVELADTGLIVGQNTCTTLGDSSKGVYICKYSDCLDEKLWYDGKTGYIVILKLTKGKVKEVTENYTQNFTPPTAGFDCHVSEHLSAVCTTTSSFLAFERTRYFMYELLNVGGKFESCPRHVCPFAIVAFSYGKTSTSLELKEKSQDKKSFYYQPWCGKLQIESLFFDVGLNSVHGAMFPAHLPKTVQVDHAIGVSELKKTLPQEVFETSLVGEVSLDGQCFNLYDVSFFEAKEEISLLISELKEKDMALVISLDDKGFLVLLHSSHFLSYEGAGTDKPTALQGMFIFPSTRNVPRETKRGQTQQKVTPEVFQVLPALNYAESEMEKCPPNQNEEPLGVLEKHLQNFAALICPGLSSSPSREASMFPDQYDVPDGFPLMAPKWTEDAGTRLKTYLEKPCSFQIPLSRALELLAAGKQQRIDDHDDDVYYYISSPEEVHRSPAVVDSESNTTREDDCVNISSSFSDEQKNTEQQAEKQKALSAELSLAALLGEASTPGTVVVATTDNSFERTEPSPKSGDLPTEHYVNYKAHSEKASQQVTASESTGDLENVFKETQTPSVPFLSPTENGSSSLSVKTEASQHTEVESPKNINCNSQAPRSEDQSPCIGSDISKEAGLPMSISTPVPSECNNVPQKRHDLKLSKHHGRRKRRGVKRHPKLSSTPPNTQNTMLHPTETLSEQSVNEVAHSSPSTLPKKDWRSLPRQKRQWKADVTVKRILRSVAKTSETESLEKSAATTEVNVTGKSITSTPKRKAEGFSMRERYGLKTIITDCGKVFVPHGSEVATGDVTSPEKKAKTTTSEKVEATQSQTTEILVSSTDRKCSETAKRKGGLHPAEATEGQDASSVTTDSPSQERPSVFSSLYALASDAKTPPPESETTAQHITLTHTQNTPVITSPKTLSSQAEKDITTCTSSDQPLDSSEKNKNKSKGTLYRAISISKLKTVLKRAKRTASPDRGGGGKSVSDSADPALKKSKANDDVESCELSLHTDAQDKNNSPVQHNSGSTGSQNPGECRQSKQSPVSWRELRTSLSQENQMSNTSKEHGCINVDTSASNEIVKQADQQLIGDRVGAKKVSSDDKSGKEGLPTGILLPSDALNLLADLALSANSEKSLTNLGTIPSQETHAGVKTNSTQGSVLHTLLRGPSAKFKLPPKSSSPEGLVATGDLILEISKEHSYSQPTSLLLGLSGAFPQIPPPIRCIESLLSLNAGVRLKLPRRTSDLVSPEQAGRTGRRHLATLDPSPPSASKSRVRRSKFLCHRRVVVKEGSIQVTRFWKETYDFRFDSKFTNDCLDKTVTRALHGKWDFGIEDTYEQVHLILHMWIGLFYSKHISRFFHFDNNFPSNGRKDAPLERTEKGTSPVQAETPQLGVDLSSEKDKTSSLPLGADILDLSVKPSGPVEHDTVLKEMDEKESASSTVIQSRLENVLEIKDPGRTQESAIAKQLCFLNYRRTADILDDCSKAENDVSSDPENDTTDGAYTEHLENNSAYSHLCEQASKICIDEQKSPIVQKQCKPETVQIRNAGKINFGPKAVTVFHQVVDSVKPVNIPKSPGQVPGRKLILKSLSFIDKSVDGTATSVCTEIGTKVQDCEAATSSKENDDSAQMFGFSGNCKDESDLKIQLGRSPVCTTAVCEPNSTDDTSVDVHNVDDQKVMETNIVSCDFRGETPVVQAGKGTNSPMLDLSVHDVKNETSSEQRDMNDDANDSGSNDLSADITCNAATCAGQNDTPAEMQNEKHKDVSNPNVEDELPIHEASFHESRHNVSNETVEECDMNDNEKVGGKAVLDVGDDTIVHVQQVADSMKDGAEPVHELSADTPAEAQFVNDDANDGNKSKSDCEDLRSVNAHDVYKKEGIKKQEVIEANDLKEQSFEENQTTGKEITKECAESEKSNDMRLVFNKNSETDNGEQNDLNDLENDDKEIIDMDICAENDSEDDSQGDMCEVNVSGSDSKWIPDEEELVKTHNSEIRSETSVVSIDKKHSEDNAQPEIAKVSSLDNMTSTVNPVIMNEGHTSPTIAGTCIPAEDKCETTLLDNSPVVQVKTPEISLAKPDVSPCSGIVNPEPGEVSDSILHDSMTDDIGYLNASLEQSLDSSILETQKTVTDHKWASSANCKKSADAQNCDSQSMSPKALEIDTDPEKYSRSCTPTQDELPYNKEAWENIHEFGGLQDNHDSDRDLPSVNSSSPDTGYGIDPDSYASLHTSVGKCIYSSYPYKAQSCSQEPTWSKTKYKGSKSLTDGHVPKQNSLRFDQDSISPSRDFSTQENQLQKDFLEPVDRSYPFGIFPKQYDEHSSEMTLSQSHGPDPKIDGPNKLREWCPYDKKDSEGSFTHFRSSTFAQKEVADMPGSTRTNYIDALGWAQQVYYADSVFTLDEKVDKAFHYRQTDLDSDHRRKKYLSSEESESHNADSTSYNRKKSRKSYCRRKWEKEFDEDIDYSLRKTFSCLSDQTKMSREQTSTPHQRRQPFNWRRYFRREGVFESEGDNRFPHEPPSSIVTVFDGKGNRAIFEAPSIPAQSVDTRSTRQTVEDSQHWKGQPVKSNITQSLIDLEYLTFSEKLNHMLRNCKDSSRDSSHRSNPVENPMTIQFSRLDEDDGYIALEETWPALTKFKINVEMSDRKGGRETVKCGKSLHFQSLLHDRGTEASSSKIAEVKKECVKSYNTMMDEVCAGKHIRRQNDIKRKWDFESASGSKRSRFCRRIKKDMLAHLHDNLNSIVRQACKTKYEFYILATSSDPFFEETKELLEEEGHFAVEPYQFDIDGNNQTPLLIILRNEDIAEHICEVPHLLELKKSSRVLFAGIDQPDDVVNLTHQELFAKGGFVVFDETTLEQMSLENMKKVVATLEELDKKGKWKWFLHYKGSRKFRENARCSPEAQKKKHFIDCCQEAGLLEVLPYHECDVISRDRPDYLRCLIRLQIQNASVRFPVFITDAPADSFEKNGILIMNISTFTQIL